MAIASLELRLQAYPGAEAHVEKLGLQGFSQDVHAHGAQWHASPQRGQQAWAQLRQALQQQTQEHNQLLGELGESLVGEAGQQVTARLDEYSKWCAQNAAAALAISQALTAVMDAFAALRRQVPEPDKVKKNRADVVELSQNLPTNAEAVEVLEGKYRKWQAASIEALAQYYTAVAAATVELPEPVGTAKPVGMPEPVGTPAHQPAVRDPFDAHPDVVDGVNVVDEKTWAQRINGP